MRMKSELLNFEDLNKEIFWICQSKAVCEKIHLYYFIKPKRMGLPELNLIKIYTYVIKLKKIK